MKNPINFIIDFESIGANVFKLPVLDAGFTRFDWSRFESNNPYTFDEIVETSQTLKVSVEDQMKNYGCAFKKRDVDWWASQGTEARAKIMPRDDDLTLREFCDRLTHYLTDGPKISYWWSRSNTFDPIVLQRIMMETDNYDAMTKTLKYGMVRDTRTYIDAKFDFKHKNGFCPVSDEAAWNAKFNGHDSTHDITADIMRLQTIVRAENDLTQVTLND